MYHILLSMYHNSKLHSHLLTIVKDVLNENSHNNIWIYPQNINAQWIANAVKLRLKDQLIQSWYFPRVIARADLVICP